MSAHGLKIKAPRIKEIDYAAPTDKDIKFNMRYLNSRFINTEDDSHAVSLGDFQNINWVLIDHHNRPKVWQGSTKLPKDISITDGSTRVKKYKKGSYTTLTYIPDESKGYFRIIGDSSGGGKTRYKRYKKARRTTRR